MHAHGQPAGARGDIIAAERALSALVELAAGIERKQMRRNDRAAAKCLKYVAWPIRPAKRHYVSPFRTASLLRRAKKTNRLDAVHGLRYPRMTSVLCCRCCFRAAGELKSRPKIVDSVCTFE